jgi:hypothetical protein
VLLLSGDLAESIGQKAELDVQQRAVPFDPRHIDHRRLQLPQLEAVLDSRDRVTEPLDRVPLRRSLGGGGHRSN